MTFATVMFDGDFAVIHLSVCTSFKINCDDGSTEIIILCRSCVVCYS